MSNELPLFGGQLVSVGVASKPAQPTLAHCCAACLGTGWVNRGTRQHPLWGYCVCAAGDRAFQDKLAREEEAE